MADTRPTKITCFYALYLCILIIFCPEKFVAEQEKDNQTRENFSGRTENKPGPIIVRRALGISLLLVLISGLIGYGFGMIAVCLFGCASTKATSFLQILGVLVLLWATLFVRGWQIQTYYGATLTERVNQWLFRSLYCVGTTILVFSLTWPQC